MNFCSDCPHDSSCLDSCLKLHHGIQQARESVFSELKEIVRTGPGRSQAPMVMALDALIMAVHQDSTHPLREVNVTLTRTVNDQARRLVKLDDELRVTDELLADRQRVLDAIPCCQTHGSFVPHALRWIEDIKADIEEWSRLKATGQRLAGRLKAIRDSFEKAERGVDYRWQLSRLQDELEDAFQLRSSNLDALPSLTVPTLAGIPVRLDTSLPRNELHVEQSNGDTLIFDITDLPSGFARCGVCRADYPIGTRHDCKATEPTI